MNSGNAGEGHGGEQEDAARYADPRRGNDAPQQHEENSADLRGRIQLAEDAGPEIANAGGDVEHSCDQQNAKIAAEHKHGVSPGDLLGERQDEKGRAEQQLVGNRVKVLTQSRLLMEPAREQAVEGVADAGQQEEGKGDAILAIEDLNHQKGDDEQPQQREQVGRGAKLAEKGHGEVMPC